MKRDNVEVQVCESLPIQIPGVYKINYKEYYY